jgi:hypothetical protein
MHSAILYHLHILWLLLFALFDEIPLESCSNLARNHLSSPDLLGGASWLVL